MMEMIQSRFKEAIREADEYDTQYNEDFYREVADIAIKNPNTSIDDIIERVEARSEVIQDALDNKILCPVRDAQYWRDSSKKYYAKNRETIIQKNALIQKQTYICPLCAKTMLRGSKWNHDKKFHAPAPATDKAE